MKLKELIAVTLLLKITLRFSIFLYTSCFLLIGCNKDWLDVKPNSQQVVLNTSSNSLSDYQTLMQGGFSVSAIAETGTDDYFVSSANIPYLGTNIVYYLWAPNGYETKNEGDWDNAYQYIYDCNIAIAGMGKVTRNSNNSALWDLVYGSAFFWRGYEYFQLSQAFMSVYDSNTVSTDLGVPLRLSVDLTQKVGRGTAQQVYIQILSDLEQAKTLLPIDFQQYRTEPTRGAVFALLAEIYLSMSDYENAFINADSALSYNNTLLDYNTLRPFSGYMPTFNENSEVIFNASYSTYILDDYNANSDTTLYKSYADNDLRKSFFFDIQDGLPVFYGTYNGTYYNSFFAAPAVDEIYLIRAECYARQGNANDALADLDTLLKKRWISNTFVPYTGLSADSALSLILAERRKELVMRGTRWSDLRRLNKDPKYASTITRIYDGQIYTLVPGSNLYVWPIPEDEILYSGIAQNPR